MRWFSPAAPLDSESASDPPAWPTRPFLLRSVVLALVVCAISSLLNQRFLVEWGRDELVWSSQDLQMMHSKRADNIRVINTGEPSESIPDANTAPPAVDHLLSVPFYVYTDIGLAREGTINGEPFSMERLLETNSDSGGFQAKHADDLFLAEAALNHPMRTLNPDEAKLFFVPSPLNYIASLLYYGGTFCLWNGTVCNQDVVKHVEQYLGDSPWFQRHQGRDHVIVASHWVWHNAKMWVKHFSGKNWTGPTNIHDCGMITFENKCPLCRNQRVRFPSYYVGTGCSANDILHDKKTDFAMIATLKKGLGVVEERKNLCRWIKEERSDLFRMTSCGKGDQCPALGQAKFGFHVKGDTFGANRLMDTMLSGTVPIFTEKEQYDVLPKWIDWEKISYFADIKNKESFVSNLTVMINDTEQYELIHQNVLENRALFDFRNHADLIFDTYMYKFQISLWPEQRRNVTTKYSALISDENRASDLAWFSWLSKFNMTLIQGYPGNFQIQRDFHC